MAEETIAYKCPSCGAPLEYSALTQNFTCHYCGSAYSSTQIDEITAREAAQAEERYASDGCSQEQSEEFAEHNTLYSCPSCGAGIITDETTASVYCHYCNSPVILVGKLSGEFRPDYIIPFKKTKDDALNGFKVWCGKRLFVPKGFKNEERVISELKAVYVPFWLADCLIDGDYAATAKKSTSSRTGNVVTTLHRVYDVVRRGSVVCSGVPADGSSKADDTLMESIEPYNYDEMIDFDMSYLSGHTAEKYDVVKEAVQDRITARVTEEAEQMFKSTIEKYSSVTNEHKNFKIANIKWKYALLPVWFLSYTYRGQLYCYAMNGQTGKFGGKLPLDKKKLYLAAGIPAIIILLLSTLGGLLP